jgi:Tfp pilus assembly protein PilN
MVTINLLPWRDYQRAFEERRLQGILLLTLLLSLGGGWVWNSYVQRAQVATQRQIELLKQKLHEQVGPQRLQRALSASAMQWQQKGEAAKKLFTWLNSQTLQPICFTEIRRDQNIITFLGRARAASDLTDFFNEWDAAGLFAEIKIDHIRQQPNNILTFRFHGRERI